MSDVTIKETCSCGASIYSVGSSYRSREGGGDNGSHRSAEEVVERWRAQHRHEFAPPAPPTDANDEQHEHRDTDSMTEQIGQPRYIGFAPEPEDSAS